MIPIPIILENPDELMHGRRAVCSMVRVVRVCRTTATRAYTRQCGKRKMKGL